jgi:flavin reductase (DIM6/NTAB) family NADH-FMN oxidoreductase RutF
MFKKISPYDLDENVFKLLDKEWMLVTAGKGSDVNTMTASWGHLGIMWNLPVAICYIRPQRHTFGFANRYDEYTLSFFGAKHRDILKFCGSKSGRDHDKIAETGLVTQETEAGNVYFEQARLVLECKKIYQDDMRPENFVRPEIAEKNYPNNDFHRFYFGEIIQVLVKQ